MWMPLIAQVSPRDRVSAVHEHFSSRSWAESWTALVAALIFAVVLCGVLLIMNRIQRNRIQKQEREHERRMNELTHQGHKAITTPGIRA